MERLDLKKAMESLESDGKPGIKVIDVGHIAISAESHAEFLVIDSILKIVVSGSAAGVLELKRMPILLDEAKKAIEKIIEGIEHNKGE